ncbi:hypothetical protein KC19_2G028000 [Ceratodon purpureus]|uniref:Uncharacterized protein n=1 Tax=Ceratodon purpureus TaxID=3225 RepID=A0A8T0ITE7_CERPU|nr:hypothetical protein KC19_2G028000 [Ceratodon purpureus]KAG0585654.1 hypothetical protein KC19_2G028000 [Ceratodon purpureus]KAG0585655.1 hypothetical protein KC19_2G028000 [Ceratodon purpureus]KAG0585656.1 hypothetical protein KC19_2G028000 [Ceratodon purpureus]
MDHGEIWTTRVLSTKRLHSLQPFQAIVDGQISIDEVEAEEVDMRAEFSCPYCYEEFDANALCVHIEDDHCFESKVATCPICAVRIVKDLVGHISQQHGQYFKMHRRRKFKRAGTSSNATLSLLGKDLHEAHLGDLIEGTSVSGGLITNPIDPLLATLVYNVPITDVVNAPKPTSNIIEKIAPKQALPSLSQHVKPNAELSMSIEERKEKQKEAEIRAKFVQELVLSTLVSKK